MVLYFVLYKAALKRLLQLINLRRCEYAQNISAQKASKKKGSRLQKKNEYGRRQKGTQETPC